MESEHPKQTNTGSVDHLEPEGASSGWMTVNGVQLHYVCRGEGPCPLLLIPAALGCAEQQYQPQLEHFGREGSGFKVVSFDPRGYGKSRDIERPKSDSFVTDAIDGHKLMSSL